MKHTNALWMRSIQFAVIGFDLKFSPPNAHPLPPPRSPLLNSHIPIPNMYKSKPHHSCLHAKCHHIINLIFAFSFFLQLKSPLHSSHQRSVFLALTSLNLIVMLHNFFKFSHLLFLVGLLPCFILSFCLPA